MTDLATATTHYHDRSADPADLGYPLGFHRLLSADEDDQCYRCGIVLPGNVHSDLDERAVPACPGPVITKGHVHHMSPSPVSGATECAYCEDQFGMDTYPGRWDPVCHAPR